MIVVATSGLSQCPYCVIAHGAILRIFAKNPQIADQVAIHHGKADLSPRQKAMLDFACKLSRTPEAMSDADHEILRGHGELDGRGIRKWPYQYVHRTAETDWLVRSWLEPIRVIATLQIADHISWIGILLGNSLYVTR